MAVFQKRSKLLERSTCDSAASATDAQRKLKAAFNAVGWHDSQLINMSIVESPDDETSTVILDLRLVEHAYRKSSRAIFEDSFALNMEIDFHSKKSCSHHIGHAECFFDSDFKKRMKNREVPKLEVVSLQDYLNFEIWLVAPAGRITILARNFILDSSS